MKNSSLVCSIRHVIWGISTIIAVVFVSGCGTTKQAQLEKAAKDWCATIRASQVIPVYPLTEDIQPGDIFLVQLPVDQQQQIYQEKGYLPLDNHLDRLNPNDYSRFYSHNFLEGQTNVLLPADWMRPEGSLSNTWIHAPNAAFPTYSFTVQRGAGINLAFPVEGVPVGLSLLGSDAAEGTVIIKNAHTLGVDTLSLYRQLKEWAATNFDFLSYFGKGSKPNYLRVVTRIYAVGNVDISLRDASSHSGGADVGAAKPVDLLAPQLMQGTNADAATIRSNFVSGNNVLQDLMTTAGAAKDAAGSLLPGGSLRLTAASGRTLSMRETFDPPLVIGYLAFDCVIGRAGQLGPPIPTFGVLDKQFHLASRFGNTPTAAIYSGVVESALYQMVSAMPNESEAARIKQQMDALSTFIPPNPRRYSYDEEEGTLYDQDSRVGSADDYLAFRRYLGERKTGQSALSEALANPHLKYVLETGHTSAAPVEVNASSRGHLTAIQVALAKPLPLEEQQAISDATSAMMSYFIRQMNP